jgi:PD-(D/E)XK nuclease superfamily
VPLTLVLGPANSAKAGEVLSAFAAAAGRGAILVVPTAVDADHYACELAEQGAVLGPVVTFSGLAREIARRTGCGGRRLTSLQRERVLAGAVEAAGLEALRAAAGTPGFVASAGELIAELERSLVTPERFAAAMASWAAHAPGRTAAPDPERTGARDPGRTAYAREVAAIYQGYAAALERVGRVDGELHAWRALDALRAAPGRWGSEAVFFYGFDDLHPLERDAIETLARVVGVEVTVSLTYEAGRTALSARAEVVEELRPLADRVLELPALDEHYTPSSRAVLHHLERRLFEPAPAGVEPGGAGPAGGEPGEAAPARVEPGDAVALLEAGGERAEAELAAAEVLALLGAGMRPREIAVVHRSLERAAPVIEHVFGCYGIRVAIDRRPVLRHTSLGHALVALARCAWLEDGQARADDLIGYLRSPGLLERPELIDRLEAEIRREAVRTLAQARARLDGAAGELGRQLGEIDALRSSPDPAGDLERHARRLLAAPQRMQAPVLGPDEELDAHALAALVKALAELEELGGLGEGLTGSELLELLERLEVRAGSPAGPDAVLVADPLAIRARRFRAVLVGGLQESEFPLSAAPDPFLPDELRRELAVCSGLRLRPREDSLARERYLFYSTISRATERVILSYRSSDEEGNLALPSPFLADVAELLVEDWRKRRRRRMLSDVVWAPEQAPTARELARSRAAAAAPLAGDVPSPIGSLSEPALAHVRHRQILSAGALEAYADCPVKWLVERELQPQALEPDSDALARGSYMHAVLEDVLRRLDGPVTNDTLPRALELLDAVLAERPHAIAPGRGEAVRAAWTRIVAADLRRYLVHEARHGPAWRHYGLELRFGFDDDPASLPPLTLEEGVRLRGIIDRVDVDPAGHAVVRDYKSGSSRPEHQGARWEADRQLQVPLYMLAVRRLLGLEPVGGFYQPLGGGDLRARGVFLEGTELGDGLVANDARDREALDELLQEARTRAVALAARLREGELEPCPATCSRDGCSFPGICRA